MWATIRGYPPWPAIAQQVGDGLLLCRFFSWRGSHATLSAEACQPFEKFLGRCMAKLTHKKGLRTAYIKAVGEARAYLEAHCPRRSSRRHVQRDLHAEAAAFLPEEKQPSNRSEAHKRTALRREEASSSRGKKKKKVPVEEIQPLRNCLPADIVEHGFVECPGAAAQRVNLCCLTVRLAVAFCFLGPPYCCAVAPLRRCETALPYYASLVCSPAVRGASPCSTTHDCAQRVAQLHYPWLCATCRSAHPHAIWPHAAPPPPTHHQACSLRSYASSWQKLTWRVVFKI